MIQERPRARIDGAKMAFLGAVGLCAGAIAALLAELPPTWRTASILWLLIGAPLTFAVMRLWRGYVQMQLEALARAPQQPPAAWGGVGGHDRPELRVVKGSDGQAGRRLL